MKLFKTLLVLSVILNIALVFIFFEPFSNNAIIATKDLPLETESNNSGIFNKPNRNLGQAPNELAVEGERIKRADAFTETSENCDIINTNDFAEQALVSYRDFIKGEKTVQSLKITIPYKNNPGNYIEEMPLDKYALFDMNGDDLPELHTLSWQGYDVFTYQNGEMIHWYWANSYTQPLNNKAVLMTHLGGSNSTTHYAYHVLDFYGSRLLRVDFFCSYKNFDKSPAVYDETSRYFFEDVEVTMEEWQMLTDKYLSVGTDQIEWHTPDEEVFPYF